MPRHSSEQTVEEVPVRRLLICVSAARNDLLAKSLSQHPQRCGGFRPVRRLRLYPQMAAQGSRGIFRLNPVDRLGRKIDDTVFAAAEAIFPRAFEHGLKLLGDPAIVMTALEEVAATVSRAVAAKDPPGEPVAIRDMPGYLFRAFLRHINRLKRKQLALVSLSEVSQIPPVWADPSRELELKILADECLGQCDPVAQDMFWRRMQGFSWEEIGKVYDESAHAAEARFSAAMRRARARLKI